LKEALFLVGIRRLRPLDDHGVPLEQGLVERLIVSGSRTGITRAVLHHQTVAKKRNHALFRALRRTIGIVLAGACVLRASRGHSTTL